MEEFKLENWKLEIAHVIANHLEHKRLNLIKSQKEKSKEEEYEEYGFEEAYQIYKEKYSDKKIERKDFYLFAIDILYDHYNVISFPEINAGIDKRLNQDMLEEIFEQVNTKDDSMDILVQMQKIDKEQLKKIQKDIESKKKEEVKKKKKHRLKYVQGKVRITINKYSDNTMEKMCEEYNERSFGYKLTVSTFHSVINEYAAAVGLKEPFNEVNNKYTKIKCRNKTKEFFWRLVDCAYGNSVVNKSMSKTEIEEYRKCRNEIEIENADPMIRQEILWEFVDHILWKSIINQDLDNRRKKGVKKGVKFKNIVLIIKIAKKPAETKEVISSFFKTLSDNGITGSYSYLKIIKDIKMEIEDLGDKLFIEDKKIKEIFINFDNELKEIKIAQKNTMEKTEDYFLQPEYLNILNREIYNIITKIYKKIHSKKEKLLNQEKDIYDKREKYFKYFINEFYKEIKDQVSYIKKYGDTFLSVCIENVDINITEIICLGNYIRILFVVCIMFLEKPENYIEKPELYYKDMKAKIERIRNDPKTKKQFSIGWYKNYSKRLENICKLEKEMYSENKELEKILKESNEIVDAVVEAIQLKIFYIMNDEEIKAKKLEGLRIFSID